MGYEKVQFPEKSRFLVTGGAGFIGSNLCAALLKKGCIVRCLDNLSNGRRENLVPFLENPDFEFIEGDIREMKTCQNCCEGMDYVLHEAAWGSVPRSIEIPLFYCENNTLGTLNLFQAASEAKVKRIVFASSSSVYGDAPQLPKQEGSEGNLLSPYALTKRECEEWARQFFLHRNLPVIGLRYFNVFGRNQNPNSQYAAVIPKFIFQLLQGKQPLIHGDGLQSRDFTYVENVVEANLKACLAPEEANGQIFNISYGGQVTLLELYQEIARGLGLEIQPQFGPPRPGDIRHSNGDISKARRLLGYNPSYSFQQGLKETLSWYKAALSSYLA